MFTRTSPPTGPRSAEVTGFHDPDTGSIQYVVSDPATGKAALIDIVLDFDPASAGTSTVAAQAVLDHVAAKGLEVAWILDTHPHADHMMASAWLKDQTGAPTGIGEKVRDIAALWEGFYNLPGALDPDRDFDRLFEHGETFRLGTLDVAVMLSPGHTLGSVTYLIGDDAAFVHDTLMYLDFGTSRADFPGGSSGDLWNSLQAILALPDATRLFVGHDYVPRGARTDPAWEASVAEHKAHNVHLAGGIDEAAFRAMRDARDATLALPDRMLHALQVNLRGGRMPPPEADGRSYFKIPANSF